MTDKQENWLKMAEKESRRARRKRKKEIVKNRRAADKATAVEERRMRAANGTLGNSRTATLRKLGERYGGYDYSVAIMVIIFSLFGVAMVFSAGYYQTINTSDPNPLYYLTKQLGFAVSGWILMFGVANFDYHRYSKLAIPAVLISIGLLVLVLLIGSTTNNAQRWITILGVRITPSELSKFLVIIFTSAFLAKNPDNIRTLKGLGILLLVMGIHFGLIVKQPNLSTAIVIVVIMIAIMIVAGMNLLLLAFPAAAAIGGYFYIIRFRTPYHWYQRLTSFIDPLADRQGDGYQVTQGLIALGNGGVRGLGFGKSIAKNMYLPEPQNDFILAIIGEELGFIGFLILMLCYMFLLYKLMLIAVRAEDKLGFYLATGVAVMLGLQVIINVAVVTSSMPATGITLPFISYGGTSMWSFMISMGISLNVSKKKRSKAKKKKRAQENPAQNAAAQPQPVYSALNSERMGYR